MLGLLKRSEDSSNPLGPRAAYIAAVIVSVLSPILVAIPVLRGSGDSSLGPKAPASRPLAAPVDAAPTPVPEPPPPPPVPIPPLSATIGPDARLGASGPGIQALEERLAALTYLVGNVDGMFDKATGHGLIAFQKVEGLERTGVGDPATLTRLDQAKAPEPAYSDPPDHLEVDIPRQVVFVVRGGKVTATLPTSTGSNKLFTSEGRTRRAVTPNGRYQIAYKRKGWRKSPLGVLYRPAYFNGGIAFHGAPSVPTRPVSHGCVRLPMPFADWFAVDASPVGMVVYVYGGSHGENPQPAVADTPAPPPASPEQPAPEQPSPAPPGEPVVPGLPGLNPAPTPSPTP